MDKLKKLIIVSKGNSENGHRLTAASYAGIYNMARALECYLTNTGDVAILTTDQPMSKQISEFISERIISEIFRYDFKDQRERFAAIKKGLHNAFKVHPTVILILAPADADHIVDFFYEKILGIKNAKPEIEYMISTGRTMIACENQEIHWLIT